MFSNFKHTQFRIVNEVISPGSMLTEALNTPSSLPINTDDLSESDLIKLVNILHARNNAVDSLKSKLPSEASSRQPTTETAKSGFGGWQTHQQPIDTATAFRETASSKPTASALREFVIMPTDSENRETALPTPRQNAAAANPYVTIPQKPSPAIFAITETRSSKAARYVCAEYGTDFPHEIYIVKKDVK